MSKMTVERGQATLSPDPQASLRTELVGQLAGAQFALESAIAELSRNAGGTATLSASRQQLASLTDLLRQIGTASLAQLSDLRREVASTAASAIELANQATSVAGNSAGADANLTPTQRARAAIEALHRELFENRVLDPYLQFATPEEEEAYRQRERERNDEIKRALALGTPEGDHSAANLMQEQLRDAGAHGADRSPDFADMVQRADEAMADLRPQTREQSPANVGVQSTQSGTPGISDDGFGDILAALKAAGVTTPVTQASDAGHGVALTIAQAREGASPVRQG